MKKTTLGFVLSCLLGLCLNPQPGRAQNPEPQVPAAIKYQAVLRDINGGMLASREDVDIRITLRLGDPLTGDIVYQEDFNDITTDAYGLVHLNIGRGERTAVVASLLDVPWGEDDIYVQVEIQLDGNGYTNMGNSELLTVPYAFMAARAGTAGVDFGPLSDGALPKYNAAGKNFVNSGLRKVPDSLGRSDSLEISASAIYIHNAQHPDERGYTLPVKAGRKGHVLVLQDNKGTLGWDTVGGSSFIHSGGYEGTEADDERLLYWNDDEGEIRSSALLYHYKLSGGGFEVLDDMDVNKNLNVDGMIVTDTLVGLDTAYSVALRVVRLYADRVGANTAYVGLLDGDLVLADSMSAEAAEVERMHAGKVEADSVVVRGLNACLTDGRIWIGDDGNTNREHSVSGVIQMNRNGVTSLNLALDPRLKLSLTGGHVRDSLYLDLGETPDPGTDPVPVVVGGGADSLWLQSESDPHILYAFNKGQDSVRVGIGTDRAQARLHVAASGGDVLFTDTLRMPAVKGFTDGDTAVQFLWQGGNGAFQVGGRTTDYPKIAKPGRFSVSLGLNALAQGHHALALGFNTRSTQPTSVAVGFESKAQSKNSLAIGAFAEVAANSDYSMAIGSATVGSSRAISIGSTILGHEAEESLVMGFNSFNNAINHKNLILLGSGNTGIPGDGSIVVGRENNMTFANNIVIGDKNDGLGANGISIGTTYELNEHDKTALDNLPVGPIVVGAAASNMPNLISIGHHNVNESVADDPDVNTHTVVMIGRKLVNNHPSFTDEDLIADGPAEIVMLGSSYESKDWQKTLQIEGDEDEDGDGNLDTIQIPLAPVFMVGAAGTWNGGPLFGIDSYGFKNKNYYTSVFQTDVYIHGTFFSTTGTSVDRSDIRSKKDIRLSSYPLSLLDSVRNVSYSYKDDLKGQRHTGFIAQHVQKYFPHLVLRDREGMLGIKYAEFIPILWDFSAQLRHQNMKLEEQNKRLKSRVDELEGKVKKLEEEMGAIRSLLENKQ